MRKTILFILALASATAASAVSYDVTVETLVGGKIEDRFSFTMEQGARQVKGYDAKLLAKRYRAKGFAHKFQTMPTVGLESERQSAAASEQAKEEKKPLELAQEKLSLMRRELSAAERKIDQIKMGNETLRDKVAALEDVVSKAERNPASFAAGYAAYQKKFEPVVEVDENYERLMKKRPKSTGDVEEVELGSYCNLIIQKGNEKAVSVDLSYAYSRQFSSFYSDGNNNDNTITKFPIFEKFEKMGVKNLVINVGKTYCFQFGRPTPDEAKTLQEALSSTSVFGGSGDISAPKDSETAVAEEPKSPLDAAGYYTEIKRKFPSDAGKTVRMLITVKLVRE